MPRTFIKNARIILNKTILKNGSILIGNSKINKVGKFSPPSDADVVDAKGLFVASGFIDTHIHGDPRRVFRNEIRYGTTAIVSAISCASQKKINKSINSIESYIKYDSLGKSVLGLRFEGPFISKARAGAQDKKFIHPPSVSGLKRTIKRCGGLLKIMTIAPEIKGAARIIRELKNSGVIASIGHTDADYRTSAKAADAGATHATHLFNGMRRTRDEDAGAAMACLNDKRVRVEIIFDMIHVKSDLLRLALTRKSKKSIILITDSVRAETGIDRIDGGVYRLKNGTIAGSGLTMIGAVKNVVTCCGVSIIDAVKFAAENPARLLGVYKHKGSIARAKDADIVIFDKNFDVKMTIVRGKIMYRKRGF